MVKEYSIAQARDHLSQIVHEAEKGIEVRLTRRGKTVAILLAEGEVAKLRGDPTDSWRALVEWRTEVERAGIEIDAQTFEGLRDHSPGRDI